LIGLIIAVILVAIIAVVIVFITNGDSKEGCDQKWQKKDGGSCVSRCSDGLSTWDGTKCVKCAESQFAKENKCTEQCAGNSLDPYWDPLKKKCVACSFKWEEIRGKICFEKCKGHNYNE